MACLSCGATNTHCGKNLSNERNPTSRHSFDTRMVAYSPVGTDKYIQCTLIANLSLLFPAKRHEPHRIKRGHEVWAVAESTQVMFYTGMLHELSRLKYLLGIFNFVNTPSAFIFPGCMHSFAEGTDACHLHIHRLYFVFGLQVSVTGVHHHMM